jgi:hypothetical protein
VTLNPKLRERAIQVTESFVLAVFGGAASAALDYAVLHPALTSEGIAHLWEVARLGGLMAGLAYWKNRARVPEAHLPELGSKGDRHTDPPPPPLAVVAVAKAAVEAMKTEKPDDPRPERRDA